MKSFVQSLFHHSTKHIVKIHSHIERHAKNLHAHVKRHGKWYIYGHLLAASAIFSLVVNYNADSSAANVSKAPLCTDSYNMTNIILDYQYTSSKKDVRLRGISFNNVVFPNLILVKNVKQISPMPNKNELSTDRGDLATYNNINKEDPNETEIAEYLSNNNLNNIIDGEGLKEVVLDVEFALPMYDNNSTGDAVGEIMIFERGMNSDMYVQAVDSLGGNVKGNKILLKRADMVYAGFGVDTVEIAGDQKMGYWRIDLSSLGVSSLKYLRINSLPVHSGPDFKIIGLNTAKCQEKKLEKLTLEQVCTSNPNLYRKWKVTNPNSEDVLFDWNIYKTTQSGSMTVGANTGVLFTTDTVDGDNIARLFVGLQEQSILISSGEKCPIIQPNTKLDLVATCSPDPEVYRSRKVVNTNDTDVEYTWKINHVLSCGTNKVEVCQVPPGNPENEHEICVAKNAVSAHIAKGSYLGVCQSTQKTETKIVAAKSNSSFYTPVPTDGDTVSIYVDAIKHDNAETSVVVCEKQPVNDYTVSITADKDEVLPYEDITYTLEYINNGPEAMQSGFIDIYGDKNIDYTVSSGEAIPGTDGYRVFLDALPANGSGSIVITGTVGEGLLSGDTVDFNVVISGSRDVSIVNNTDLIETKVVALQALEISSLCSENPSLLREWRIKNQNNIDVPIVIYVGDNLFTGTIAKANDFTYITTDTVEGTNTVSLRYNGAKQSDISSEGVACPKPLSDLSVESVNVEVISDQIFVAYINFQNVGPNSAEEVRLSVDVDSGSFVVDKALNTEVQQDVQEMKNNDIIPFVLTGVFDSTGNATINVEIQGNIIDPNTNNNTFQVSVPSSSSYSTVDAIDEDKDQTGLPESNVHFAADSISSIQGVDLGEKVELTDDYEGEVIGLGCNYTDESYEKIKFQDVVGHRSKPFVELLRINCIVKGKEANLFMTNDLITRAESIKVAVKLRGIKNSWKVKSDKYIYIGDTPMSDVDNGHWAAQYVDKAYKIGLLDGLYNSSKYLSPDKNITRGEAVELLVRTYLLLDNGSLNLSDLAEIQLPFEDISSDNMYKDYISYAYANGLLQGVVDGDSLKFLPDQKISRSEFAKITALMFTKFLTVYSVK